MLFSSFSTRSMVFAYFAKAQLPFSLFRDLFNDTAEFTLCYGLHDCSHLFQGYFIHSLSTLYYYNAPSLTTRLTGDYRDRTYTGKCSPALLDTHKNTEQEILFLLFLPFLFPATLPAAATARHRHAGSNCHTTLPAPPSAGVDCQQALPSYFKNSYSYRVSSFLCRNLVIGLIFCRFFKNRLKNNMQNPKNHKKNTRRKISAGITTLCFFSP